MRVGNFTFYPVNIVCPRILTCKATKKFLFQIYGSSALRMFRFTSFMPWFLYGKILFFKSDSAEWKPVKNFSFRALLL